MSHRLWVRTMSHKVSTNVINRIALQELTEEGIMTRYCWKGARTCTRMFSGWTVSRIIEAFGGFPNVRVAMTRVITKGNNMATEMCRAYIISGEMGKPLQLYCNTVWNYTVYHSVLQCITVYYSISQCITVYHSVLQYITVYYSIVQCITV